MNSRERAVALFDEGFACSQSVLLSQADEFNVPAETAAAVASCFGGGMARMGGVCGAVTGALMVIGLRGGNRTAQDKESKDRAYAEVHEFVRAFRERHGSIRCRTLLGFDLSQPGQLEAAKAAGAFERRCRAFVADAVDLCRL